MRIRCSVAQRGSIVAAMLVLLAVACASPQRSEPIVSGGPALSLAPPKRVVTAIVVEPTTLYRPLIPGSYVIQTADLADTVLNIGLTTFNDRGVLVPRLATDVPSVENGMWRVDANGQMELIWKVRPGAVWHDKAPLTADDLFFTLQVALDPRLPEFRGGASQVWSLIQDFRAVDAETIAVTWKRPYIKADRLFATGSEGVAPPLPRHILEHAYADNRETLLQLPYWNREYVGLGPFMLREWVASSHLLLDANPGYVLGKPKIEEMEIRFILDANALAASILAGAVHLTLGIGLNLEQNLELRDQWRDGKLNVAPADFWVALYPQLLTPNPAIIGDARFRRAILQAIDRQAMADTIMAGLVPIAHSYIKPTDPEAQETDRYVTRYEYDPRQAAQGLEELGYQRGGDGVFRDSANQRLALEVRATSSPAITKKPCSRWSMRSSDWVWLPSPS